MDSSQWQRKHKHSRFLTKALRNEWNGEKAKDATILNLP